MQIRQDDLGHPQTQALIQLHLRGMHANTPYSANVFAIGLSALKSPNVIVWTAWEGERICGICALKLLDAQSAELKSMRVHPDFLRQGVASKLLQFIVTQARARGLRRLSLETGSGPAFEPALALYRAHGFCDGGPFADYQPNGFSHFLHLDLPTDL